MPPSIATLFAEFITTTSLIEGTSHHDADIYNEFSLQHEFGSYLRRLFPQNKVQYERNAASFPTVKGPLEKREIDIVVFSPGGHDLHCAIELKFPATANIRRRCLAFAGISPSSNSSNATVFRPLAR